jgi:transposase-like protein
MRHSSAASRLRTCTRTAAEDEDGHERLCGEGHRCRDARPRHPAGPGEGHSEREARDFAEQILNGIEGKSTVYTDGWPGYDGLKAQEFIHDTVNHVDEYVRGNVHTQGIENFWSLLKRGLKGTYVAVEPFHLDRYLDEQMFRFNNRATKDNPLNDADRFMLAVSQISGKRLTYAELTGKVGNLLLAA